MDTRHILNLRLEFYQAYTDYNGMMDIRPEMLEIYQSFGNRVEYGDVVNLILKIIRASSSMADAVKKHAGVDFNEINSDEEAKVVADKLSYRI